MVVVFSDEHEAEGWAWLFEPMGWRMCCAGGYYNAWTGPSRSVAEICSIAEAGLPKAELR